MSTLAERFKRSRIELGYSRNELGKKLGVSESILVNIEFDNLKNPQQKEPLFKLYCQMFNISYEWLMYGIGEPFLKFPDTIIDELTKKYSLNDEAKELVIRFLSMNQDEREVITKLFAPIEKGKT